MMLNAQSVTVSLSDREIVHDVSLAIAAGEVVALLGPNGAGKSTLMRALAGIIPFAGTLSVDGRPTATMRAGERARAIAYLPQDHVVHWPISIANLVLLGRLPHQRFGQAVSAADRQAALTAMRMMQIEGLADRPATEVSGGELARALAARAIAQDTPVIIADEPAAGLDPAHQIRLMSAFRSLAAEGKAVLLSIHDIELAARWSDRVVMMSDGRIVADGAPGEAISAALLARVYGIKARIGHDECGLTLTPLGLSED
ncbi:MAG: ABC transporter ATP-binding protein [Notoacmeibacter sp.]|nr:ABC transporter ATP-binding protein [Notoacmeibacter sp.]